ncbi:MAG: hypothetical protein SGI97_10320 [candidate division Zixibacteria bacterium]|nr:hypothetical protein [candidate division Zixibacteria bacterium]
MPLLLTINKNGTVGKVVCENPEDTTTFKYFKEYFKTLTFEPGRFKGKKKKQILPLKALMKAGTQLPRLIAPVRSDSTIEDFRLYMRACLMNKVNFATLDSFPSYFFPARKKDTSSNLHYVLLEVDLDAKGKLTGARTMLSSLEPLGAQILNAANWSRYSPLKIEKKFTASKNYCVVSFYPNLDYPTNIWTRSENEKGDSSLSACWRIRFLPDTLGYMCLPVPMNAASGKLTYNVRDVQFSGQRTVQIVIDSTGYPVVTRPQRGETDIERITREVIDLLRFYPALNFTGEPKQFRGFVELSFEQSSAIGLKFDWLE